MSRSDRRLALVLRVLGGALGAILSWFLVLLGLPLVARHVDTNAIIGLWSVVLLILVRVGSTGLPRLVRHLAERMSRADRRRWSAWKDAVKQVQRALHQQPGQDAPTLSIQPDDADVRVVLDGGRVIRILALSRGATAGRVPTGDREFDHRVCAEGEEVVVLAVLNGQARAKVAHLLTAWDAELRAGRLVVRADLELADTPPRVQALLAAVRDAADVLRLDTRRMPERLARNAGDDPVPDVRLRNLAALLAAFPNTAAAREASRAALTAPEPVMRLTAAAFLGPEASATLRTLAESDSTQPHIRLAATIHYVLTVPVPEALAFLMKLRPELASLPTPTLLGNAVKQLAALDDAGREPVVIELLGRGPGAVQVAAAQALGRTGSVAAVEPLLSCASGWNAELAEAARTAVAAIQGRLGDVEAGRLSVATPAAAAGGLTAAEPGANGALSPAPEPRTSPSPTPEVRGGTG